MFRCRSVRMPIGQLSDLEGTVMQVTSSQLLSVPMLEVRGEIDHGNAQFLTQAIDEPLDRGESILLLDLTAVDYMDSGGVSVLLSTVRRLRNRGSVSYTHLTLPTI